MSDVPHEVRQLVDRFARNLDDYKSHSYNETQVRREFIDPLFKALGWDVDNEQGYAEAYKDVIHEDAIKVGGATKAPDYCFRIGGARKFFLEAKRPAVPLKEHAESAYQLRRYAWSARLPLSVLTDFEELAVYDCRIRPHKTDKSSIARTMYFTFDQYVDRWDELAAIFSRDAVLKGSFDKYAEAPGRKRGTAEVDVEFLREIEQWRETLARNFALRNTRLSVRDLNFAVQRTIDRVIFLRMCEDRGIELYGQLQGLCGGPTIYKRLAEAFRRADERYNSSLFYFTSEKGREPPDELTLRLKLDDKVLKDILGSLYYPESPYEFSVLPPEILGQVYEQFLGKVIRLTRGHRAVVEDKPEVKKAGGVYYTPTYIVDYIVKHTVGKLLEDKTPAEVGPDHQSAKRKRGVERAARRARRGPVADAPGSVRTGAVGRPLRVLDPACGSGSFLLGAYQCLLDWHRDWYVEDGPEKHRDRIYQGSGGQWRLTVQEKKRILLNHVYGVDIDPQAVEVTKLSLLLKVLEGETSETIGQTLRLFHERALPDLSDNIKCGNSLIGPDFYENRQMSLLDEEERFRINAFDWESEFPEVFGDQGPGIRGRGPGIRGRGQARRSGSTTAEPQSPTPDPRCGFDAVIGNPPWISLSGKYAADTHSPAEVNYLIHRFQGNTYMPNIYEYFVGQGLALCRQDGRFSFIVPDRLGFNKQFVDLRARILRETHVVSLLYRVPFPGITADTLIFVLRPGRAPDATVLMSEFGKGEITRAQRDLLRVRNHVFEYFEDHETMTLVQRLGSSPGVASLAEFCESTSGFGGKSQLITTEMTSPRQIRTLKGDSIGRYHIRRNYWFDFRKENITGRTTNRTKLGASPKILLRKTGDRIIATLEESGIFPEQSLYFLFNNKTKLDLRFILGILNSRLLTAYLRAKALTNRRTIAQVKKVDLDELPLPMLNMASSSDSLCHDRMVKLVRQMLDLHKKLASAKTPTDKTAIQRQIDATDREIDQLVYELYGLTEEEIRIVEGNG